MRIDYKSALNFYIFNTESIACNKLLCDILITQFVILNFAKDVLCVIL